MQFTFVFNEGCSILRNVDALLHSRSLHLLGTCAAWLCVCVCLCPPSCFYSRIHGKPCILQPTSCHHHHRHSDCQHRCQYHQHCHHHLALQLLTRSRCCSAGLPCHPATCNPGMRTSTSKLRSCHKSLIMMAPAAAPPGQQRPTGTARAQAQTSPFGGLAVMLESQGPVPIPLAEAAPPLTRKAWRHGKQGVVKAGGDQGERRA